MLSIRLRLGLPSGLLPLYPIHGVLSSFHRKVCTLLTINTAIFWDITPWAIVRTNVSEEHIAYIFRVTTIGELETQQ
jgi:hypothetical protein